MKRLTTEEFIQRAVDVHGDKYNYSEVVYVNVRTKVKIYCKKCKKNFYQFTLDHTNKQCGCSACVNKKKLTTEEFIKKSIVIHGKYKYNYEFVDYINSKVKVKIYCNKCKKYFYQKPLHHIHNKAGCPVCNLSKGENKIKNSLNIKKIKYVCQKTFMECKDKRILPFDFYLPDYNICIEYHGGQHYKPVNGMRNKKFSLKESIKIFNIIKKHDKIKKDYCKNNNIHLLEIPYWEQNNIEKILSEVA